MSAIPREPGAGMNVVVPAKRVKNMHRVYNNSSGKSPISVRQFLHVVKSDTKVAELVTAWKKNKRNTDNPKRARSKATIESRRMARMGRRKGGGSKKSTMPVQQDDE